MAAFRITAKEHAAFAAASGDRSPLHVDPVAARRRFPGEPVVHGVHVLLRALDAVVAAGGRPERPRTLRATFVRPVLPGDDAAVAVDGDTLRVLVGGVPVAVIRLDAEVPPPTAPPEPALLAAAAVPRGPDAADLPLGDLAHRAGVGPGAVDGAALAALVPRAADLLGHGGVDDLAAASAVVGMDCPGRRALLADLVVSFAPDPAGGRTVPGLAWWVERTVPAVRRVVVAVSGRHVVGRLGALVVPEPPLRDAAALAGAVDPSEFAGRRPLVVGGSRGLGATAVRLLALGGADVRVGWRTERGPAEEVVTDVRRAGGRARAVHIDVMDPAAAVAVLADDGWDGDEVLIFASPRILRRHLGAERPELLEELRAVHVTGPVALVRALADLRGGGVTVGYPSSVAIDETPDDMREYARAKAEAEAALAALAVERSDVRVVVRRLPRIVTEQTVAFTPAPAADAVSELLPLLRAVRDAGSGPA